MKANLNHLVDIFLQPKIIFVSLLIISLIASYFFPLVVTTLVDVLSSDWGSHFIPRVIIGVFSALFISAYITEKRKGRSPKMVKYVQNYFTALPLALGFYTLARWIFLDVYSNADIKFLPYLDNLGVSTLVIALVMLLNEIVKLTLVELVKLKSNKKGVQVQAIPDNTEDLPDNIEQIQVVANNPGS